MRKENTTIINKNTTNIKNTKNTTMKKKNTMKLKRLLPHKPEQMNKQLHNKQLLQLSLCLMKYMMKAGFGQL